MTERTGHTSFDMVRPELREIAMAAVGPFDPESVFGQRAISSVYQFQLNYRWDSASRKYRMTAGEYRSLAGEAAVFSERAWRLSTPETFYPESDLRNAIRLYRIAGNQEKVAELRASLPETN